MRILLTNDDGVHSPGLYALWRELNRDHEVTVVAPDRERSAVSHGITLNHPLRITDHQVNGSLFHGVTGLPADCVKIALKVVLEQQPQLVISGINRGSNTGINVLYSGTVAAAVEGMVAGIPSLAVSQCSFQAEDFTPASTFVSRLVGEVPRQSFPRWSMLNINVPNLPSDQIKGIKLTRMGEARFEEFFILRQDTRQREYYWMGGKELEPAENPLLDDVAVKEGWISVTPLKYDLTDHSFLEELQSWHLNGADN
ncbi:MAG: 5'/3'-nucleotidase SurE [Candidatus Delongbacteria bacterium]|nr:5'/3'-nucleotidase SurE [Candidatus Delongbacteria bacterium]